MNQPLVTCPVCVGQNCVECAEEVDIGVGILRKVYGYDCKECGLIPVCEACGGIGALHHANCKDMLEIINAPDGQEPPL